MNRNFKWGPVQESGRDDKDGNDKDDGGNGSDEEQTTIDDVESHIE
jgi:hypothetical protein